LFSAAAAAAAAEVDSFKCFGPENKNFDLSLFSGLYSISISISIFRYPRRGQIPERAQVPRRQEERNNTSKRRAALEASG
jgi:hypothetical protein